MKYVVKRIKVRYLNGTESPECYYKENPFGFFVELTSHIEEAAKYSTKREATKVAKSLGNRFFVDTVA